MSWNKPDELVVASNGQVYVAPVGTALPTTTTGALNASFTGLGLTSEDGVTLTVTPTVDEFMAWQSRQAVRRELTAQEVQVTFQLEQWNESTIPLAFGGGTVSNSGGTYRFDLPETSDALDERSMVIDTNDGDRNIRIVIPRGNVTDAVESQFVRSSLAMLPITFKALEPDTGGGSAYLMFDDAAAFAAGS